MRLPILRDTSPLVKQTLRVGELAKRAGKTVRAIHLYEERGLLVPVERSKGGYRLYDADSITRVRWIAKLQDMGYSLSDIQAMVREWERSGSAPDAMLRVQRLLRDQLQDTRAQIAKLRELEGELQAGLEYLQTCPSCDPKNILDACNTCDQHEEGALAPELVAGFHAH